MKKINTVLYFAPIAVLLMFFTYNAQAQCTANQSKVKVLIRTDNYGHETFWQIKNAATNAVIKSGGNPKAYPGGLRGTAASDPGAYPNATIRRDSVCVDHGTIVKFVIYDAYGDGICCNYGTGYYYVFVGTDTVVSNTPFTVNDSTLFSVPLPAVDLTVATVQLGNKITVGNHFIDGAVKNKGTETITSFTLNWSVDGGVVRKEVYNNVSIGGNKSLKFKHKYGWHATTTGNHELKIWVSNINDNGADEFTANDTLKKALTVFQNNRVVLVEAWTNASCPPCAKYMPPLEELLDHSNNHVVSIMYHSDYPGYDVMNTHNPQQSAGRGGYYSVNSYPSWFIDGADQGTGFVTAQKLYDRSLIASSFDFIEPMAWIENDTIYAKTLFQAKSNFTGNFRAHAVVIEKDIDFTNGPNPGSNGERTFDWVMKYMLTGTGGKNVGSAFVAGKTDSFDGKWKLANVYDTTQLAVVFFIQNNTGKEVHAAAMVMLREQPDYTEPPTNTGMVIAENGTIIKTYPNPAKNIFNIELANVSNEEITISIMNMLGQQVALVQSGITSGNEKIMLNTDALERGLYIVTISGEGFKTSSRLLIEK